MFKYTPISSDSGIFRRDFSSLIDESLHLSHRITFLCTAISDYFLAIGCNTGNIYVFNIQNSKIKFWSNIISNDSPITGMYFSSSKYYLAYYNKKYQIFIYKLNLVNEKNLMIRQIESSQGFPVRCLRWDYDASKLFCGYSNGIVDVIYIPQNTKDYFHVPSEGVLKMDKQDIVQIDIKEDLLLVSTNEKVILMNLQSKFMVCIGSKPRSGQYGACFWFNDSKELRVVSARPGYRLWIASVCGTVEETQQYKSLSNGLTYKLKDNEGGISGSGQFVCLSMIQNCNLVVAMENEGFLYIIDLVKKLSISIIDCGSNFSKFLCNNEKIILNSYREVVCLDIITFNNALLSLLNENGDLKYAIDLFLTLSTDYYDTNSVLEHSVDRRQIFNTLSPDLLSRLVQKSAELGYKFPETNKFQVIIQDNEEYQCIFYPTRDSDSSNLKITASISDLSTDFSTELDCSTDHKKLTGKSGKQSKNMKTFRKTPQLLKTIYDKTSTFLSNIDVLSSSNSELNMVDSFPEVLIFNEVNEIEGSYHKGIADDIPENLMTDINLMELEANGYIATEKYKQISQDNDSVHYFTESLSNFCETWLTLNGIYWKQLRSFELHIRNLSASFPILNSSISISSNDSSPVLREDNFINKQSNAKYVNSWSSTIHICDWMKALPVSDKIYQMISNLLSQCFYYETFQGFHRLVHEIMDITLSSTISTNEQLHVVSFPNEYNEFSLDKEIQITNKDYYVEKKMENLSSFYTNLKIILMKQIWAPECDIFWIPAIITHFHHFLNVKSIRQWIRSGISHKVWLSTVEAFKDVYRSQTSPSSIENVSLKTNLDIEKMLFDSLCTDNIYSFVVVDEIIPLMKERGIINWKTLIESESLDIRDVLHFCLKHDLNLMDYAIQLFKYVPFSLKFSSRYSLLEYIYSQRDVLISIVYSLLSDSSYQQKISRNCECSLLISYSELDIDDNINCLTLEILRWGSDQGVFKRDPKVLEILMKLCADYSYHQGYIELLVGMSVVEKIVMIGLQVSNVSILERLKDCSSVSSNSILEVIDMIISYRKKQKNDIDIKKCLSCERSIKTEDVRLPLSWKEIGQLIFINFIDDFNQLDLIHNILPKLSHNEIEEMKEILKNCLISVIHDSKIVEKNQMFKFIKSEMNLEEANGELTERYLNIYTMSRQELAGPNWGRVITDNMVCDLCGIKLINRNEVQDVVAFCCIHTFHRNCLLQFDFNDECVLC